MREYQYILIEEFMKFACVNNFKNKIILEVGSDMKLLAAQEFVRYGAKEVYCVNPLFPDDLTSPNPKIKLIKNFGEQVKLKSNHFDCIFGIALLEHVLNVEELFKEVKRMLKPSGVVYLQGNPMYTGPSGHHVWVNNPDFRYNFNNETNPFEKWEHLSLHSRQDYIENLRKKNIPEEHIEVIVDYLLSDDTSKIAPSVITEIAKKVFGKDVLIYQPGPYVSRNEFYELAKKQYDEKDLDTTHYALFYTSKNYKFLMLLRKRLYNFSKKLTILQTIYLGRSIKDIINENYETIEANSEILKFGKGIKNPLLKNFYKSLIFSWLFLTMPSCLFLKNIYQKIKKTLWLCSFEISETCNIDIFLDFLVDTRYKKCSRILKMKSKNPVIIVETNNCHGETIPAVYKYLDDLGLKADIIALNEHKKEKSLSCLKQFKPTIWYINDEMMKYILKNGVLNKYRMVFFNSYNKYRGISYYPSVFEAYKFDRKNNLVCGFLHHLQYADECKKNDFKYFTLTNLNNEYSNENNFINPHYFGEISITKKNKITNFIAVGLFDSGRRNVNLLIDCIKSLLKEGYSNFKVTCIGKTKNLNISPEIAPYIEFLGRLSYPKMYKKMECADFFLPLLDPENAEHERYITVGTSGSFQLIYGFQKPCLIHEKFGKHHFLNNENSIIYSKDEDLYLAMKQAINMNNLEYTNMQNNLAKLSNSLYKKSLENLKNIIT